MVFKKKYENWANINNISYNSDGYLNTVAENLFKPLDLNNRYQFKKGKGGEIDDPKPKMSALHSSSALFYNFFINYQINGAALNKLLDLNIPNEFKFSFEGQNSFRVHRSTAISNLDGEIYYVNNNVDFLVGIESKFLEPTNHSSNVLKSYLVDKKLTQKFPLSIKLLNNLYYKKDVFKYFSPEQIIKHWFGLKSMNNVDCSLIYIYYDNIDNLIDQYHFEEIAKFKNYIDKEISFNFIKYSTILDRIRNMDTNLYNYLKTRYF